MSRPLAYRRYVPCEWCLTPVLRIGWRWITEGRFCSNDCRSKWHASERAKRRAERRGR